MYLGTYRYILSLMVLISHTTTLSYNIGVIAVINFLILSGYLNAGLIDKYYKANIKSYYIDRFLRIAPQFYFYFLIAILINYNSKIFDFDVFDIISNITILPLGYYLIFDNLFNYEFNLIIPATWSLGLELSFYFIFPFIILKLKNKINFIYLISFLIFMIGFIFQFYPRAINYSLLPGVLFIFLIGSYRYYNFNFKIKTLIVSMSIIFFNFIFTLINDNFYNQIFNKEVMLGILVGFFLINLKLKVSNKFDVLLGSLSYGIFLNHWIVFKVLTHYYSFSGLGIILITIILSSFFSLVSFYLIENFFSKIRKKIRYKKI